MFDHRAIHGLYVITDAPQKDPQGLITRVRQAITGGARIVQYRNKDSEDYPLKLRQARSLQELCHQHQIPLIINDDIDLAQAIAADGVHLGRSDDSLELARKLLGKQALIGISCYNQLELAILAEQQGADYVAFGSFYQSPTKPQAIAAAPSLLLEAQQRLSIPIVAIGGITPENGANLIATGASSLAVISGVFAQPRIQDAARAYTRLFKPEY